MYLVSTYIAKSKIEGRGLFTQVFIRKGTVVAKFMPEVDRVFTTEQFAEFPDCFQRYIKHHGSKTLSGDYTLGIDGDQYINHSDTPNLIRDDNGFLTAANDIEAREELTCNYKPNRDINPE